MIAVELKVVGGKHAGQTIPLNRRKFLIGREQDCQLRPNSEMVSRHHCVFSVDDFSVRLRDLGSTNGTFVNGERIRRETVLNADDRVVIGNLEFEIVVRQGKQVDESLSDSVPVLHPEQATSEDTQVTSHTVLEIPTAQPAAQPVAGQAPPAAPPQQAPPQQAQPLPSETTIINPMQMMPGQYPYQPQMMPMGYPGGMYGGFPYQPMMPGYGQMYGQPMMPPGMGYGMPQQQQPPQEAPAAPTSAPGSGVANVALPDPETTGAREAEAARGSTGASKDTTKPTGAADAIIKQYTSRRPGT